jgi:SsrA-binding protein
MTKKNAKNKPAGGTIALNKRSKHDYFLTDKFEAGIALQGWEVKSLRAGKGQLTECYVLLQNGEALLIGLHIAPLNSACSHHVVEPDRTRKLLLHRRELDKIKNAVNQKGYTCVATAVYWKGHLVKCEIALAKGKGDRDKRDTEKDRDWSREKQRLMRHSTR